ncbi:MAG: hypothetical protein HY744_23550 [Deltaproteobacteria bacterium]|nr:hypothetical protein [Deltaproteobacteria bacterium]
MMGVFAIGLVVLFMPLFGGRNALEYLDNLYNTISKGSAYYIPELREANRKLAGDSVKMALGLRSAGEAAQAVQLLSGAGARAAAQGAEVTVEGDLGAILASCLDDADRMFHNDGAALVRRYHLDERAALHTWWRVLGAAVKDLNRQHRFREAKSADAISAKAVECAYNYYRIDPQSIGDRWAVVLFSLLFYVIYTVWYGFAVLYLFEGAGLKLGH